MMSESTRRPLSIGMSTSNSRAVSQFFYFQFVIVIARVGSIEFQLW